jgi:hypothetical protein
MPLHKRNVSYHNLFLNDYEDQRIIINTANDGIMWLSIFMYQVLLCGRSLNNQQKSQ